MAYDLGDPVPLAFEVLDEDGARANAGTVTLTVTLPDGTTDSPAVANPPAAAGLYEHNYTPAQAGRHLVRWTATDPATAYTDAFDIRPAAPPLIVSLADVKRHLGKSDADTTDDGELREYIEAATALIEDIRGEAVVRRTIVEDIHARPCARAVLLSKTPIVSLTSVASVDGVSTWDVAGLNVGEHGIVSVVDGSAFCGLVRFTYVAGREVVPANYSLAAKIIIRHLWDTQRQPGLGPQPFGAEPDVMTPPGFGYAIPNRAMQLLGGRGPLVA